MTRLLHFVAMPIIDLHTLHHGCSLPASGAVPVLRVRTLAQGKSGGFAWASNCAVAYPKIQ
jgi:hypothetical protein